MPASQLKQLKTSLRDHGLVGPQKSKKQKKAAAKDAGNKHKRRAALQSIREHFNPFEVKAPARREKFEVAGIKDGRSTKGVQGRPGVTKGLGEERRRATLLKEIQSRNKVGQIVDRRFGEDDPTMTPEQRAAERFARQSERQLRKKSIFNLEDDPDDNVQLTHMGRSLGLSEADAQDDLKEDDISGSDEAVERFEEASDVDEDSQPPSKRRRLSDGANTEDQTDDNIKLSERKRPKHEVMKEVIAKSKLHKYERQQAKEDDDDLRAELDKCLPDFLETLRSYREPPPAPAIQEPAAIMNPARAALLAGKDREEADLEYNERVREMAMDKRSVPSARTKTDEEKAAEEAARLKDLEEKRLRRMKGAPESSDEEDEQNGVADKDLEQDDAEAFGLGQRLNGINEPGVLVAEDEDDFIIDDDLIASDSEAGLATENEESSADESTQEQDDGNDDFINGLVLPPATTSHTRHSANDGLVNGDTSDHLSFTFPCPATHDEFIKVTKDMSVHDIPTVVQRIRALYHPKLNRGYKEKLETFSTVLTQHVAYISDQEPHAPIRVIESLLRHLHSLAKSHPVAVATAFRAHLRDIAEHRPLDLRPGDLIILTGISTIFPTSDHFHPVVTPASLTIARFLGQSRKAARVDLVKGAYCCTLALQYQSLAKRYIPEVMTYIQQALVFLIPDCPKSTAESLIRTDTQQACPIQLSDSKAEPSVSLRFEDLYLSTRTPPTTNPGILKPTASENTLKASLVSHFLTLLTHAAELWHHKTSFPEIFEPATSLLTSLLHPTNPNPNPTHLHTLHTLHTLTTLTTHSLTTRLPLLLHNHPSRPIPTSIPKFSESYNPDKHNDPDRARSELNQLKAEHKRERKGALRELRKDASFVAREQLSEKRERDAAYEKKMRRLVAEVQGEEGREANAYERERERRKGRGGRRRG